MRGAKKNTSKFGMTDLHGTDLSDSDLTNALFRASDLRKSSFVGANLTGASIWASDASDCRFDGANLTATKFKPHRFGVSP